MTYLRGVEPRAYQKNIAENVLKRGNSLVVLPTGLGKTVVALLVMEKYLEDGKRAMFLAPTKPLVEQHVQVLSKLLAIPEETIISITGEASAKKREELWRRATIACATPQTVANDLKHERFFLEDFSFCVIDEAHRAVKNYAYTFVAQKCIEKDVHLLGLTASPGGKREKIEEVMAALAVKHIEIRTEKDADVAEYVQPIEAKYVEVELPKELKDVKRQLDEILILSLEKLRNRGLLTSASANIPKGVLLEVGRKIYTMPDEMSKFVALSNYTSAMNLMHMIDLIETQGVGSFLKFIEKLEARETKSKAVIRILTNPKIKKMVERLTKLNIEHPKLAKLIDVAWERRGKKMIVFVQYRDQIARVVEELKRNHFSAEPFMGKKDGVTRAGQRETLEKFRNGEFDILCATSIGEEGLDIPQVDCVIFFEPVPSEIRTIQRRGRTGRMSAGEVVFLVTKDTRDEAYFWSARSKERKMHAIVKGMKKEMGGNREELGEKGNRQTKIDAFLD